MFEAPRCLLVTDAPFPAATGAATRVAQRIIALSVGGLALDVLTPKTPELPHLSKFMDARILRVPMPSGRAHTQEDRYAAFERAVRRQLAGNEYDVVHVMTPSVAPVVTKLPAPGKLIYEPAVSRSTEGLGAALIEQMRHRDVTLLRAADLVLATSQEHALALRRDGALPSSIGLLRPSADLELFRPPAERRRQLEDPTRIALAAAALSDAEVTFVFEAMSRAARLVPLSLTVSAVLTKGGAALLQSLAGIGCKVELCTPTVFDELPGFYQRAEVGLVLGLGRTAVRLQALAEMMASGLAIIAPDSPEVRELLDGRRQAALVPADDAVRLAEAIVSVAGHPARQHSLGMAARIRASELVDERRAATRLLELYQQLRADRTVMVSADAIPGLQTTSGLTPTMQAGDQTQRTDVSMPVPGRITSGAHPPNPDAATAPDASIHKRRNVQLSSGAVTLPEIVPPKRR